MNRLFSSFRSTCIYYPRMIWIIIRGALAAHDGRYTKKRWVRDSLGMLSGLQRAGVSVDACGLEYLREIKGPAVIISNHMSSLETFVLPQYIQPIKNVTYIAKKTLISYPIFGAIMRACDPVIVGRENPREDFTVVMNEGVDKIKKGTSIIVFPQSTRSVEFKPVEFNSIGIKLARRAGVPVIPLAVKTDAWTNGPFDFIKDYGPIDPKRNVHFAFGPAMNITGNGSNEHRKIIEFIQENLAKWEKTDSS